jgi:two-component sensor histidine kinase
MQKVYDSLHRSSHTDRGDVSDVLEDIARGFEGADGGLVIETALARITASTGLLVSAGIILNELLTNVLKYAAPKAEATPWVSVRLRDRKNGAFEISVSDNGPGFPPEVTDAEGRGFGLTVVESLAEQHNGWVTIDNEGVDGGGRVSVVLRSER